MHWLHSGQVVQVRSGRGAEEEPSMQAVTITTINPRTAALVAVDESGRAFELQVGTHTLIIAHYASSLVPCVSIPWPRRHPRLSVVGNGTLTCTVPRSRTLTRSTSSKA